MQTVKFEIVVTFDDIATPEERRKFLEFYGGETAMLSAAVSQLLSDDIDGYIVSCFSVKRKKY